MDTEALHVALQQSFSPDARLRDPAEELIKNLRHIRGATSMLLQVTAEKQVQREVRQAAAIQLKNICRENWVERFSYAAGKNDNDPIKNKNDTLLCEEDKAIVRVNLVEALLSEHEKSIRDLLAETLYSIATHDYPDNWPNLLPTLLQTITQDSNDPSQALRLHNALLAMRKITKRYEYKSRENRGPLNEVVIQSFPFLLPLAQRLSSPNEHSLEAALMLKQILKIFWSSTQFYLPSRGDGGNIGAHPYEMQPWFELLCVTLSKPLPEASTGLEPLNQPTSIEERNAWPWWKVKKWSVQIMTRLFSRYGMPNFVEDEVQEFAQYFSKNVAPQFLKPVCETLNLRPSGQFCSDRVLHLCLSFLDHAVELAPTYKLLKPHMDFLLYKVCFQTLCLTAEDIDTFENDPHEFVRMQNSPLADYYDPRQSAIGLISSLVKHRGKDVAQPFLAFLSEILHKYNLSDDASKNHIEKDASLLAIGSLSEFLLSKKKFSSELEGLLISSVFPDFTSPVGFLRCRACWTIQRFSTVKWTDDGTRLRTVIKLVLDRLSDPALPVQIEASKALQFLIETPNAEEILLPVLPQVLNEYFRIMNEIGNDEVVNALTVIIDQFGDHIEPHAVALVSQLSNAFVTYCDSGDEDDEAAMAAIQCLECISTVLKGISERPSLYKGLEPQLIPLVLQILGNDGEYIEYLENALDILTFLTYFPEDITPQLWNTFPLIYYAFDQWAFDYLYLMISPFENFISKDTATFLSGKATLPDGNVATYIDLIFKVVSKTVSEERSTESEVRKALSLLMTVLLTCRGQIDHFIPTINDLVLPKLAQQATNEIPLTRISIYQVLGSALYYNPQIELMELEKRGLTQQVFAQWMKDSETMDKWIPRKITVLGLSTILQLPTSSLPPSIGSALPHLIASIAKMVEGMREEAEKAHGDDDGDDEGGNDDENFDDGDDDDDFEGYGEDEDVHNDADAAYMNALQNIGNASDVARFLMGGDDWDDEDEEDFSTPIDDVDELQFFNDCLRSAFEREPEVFQQVQSALHADTLNACHRISAAAELKRQSQ